MQERVFKPEYAKELLVISQGDLDSAKSLASSKQGRPENILFLAEQAVEKALKAVLCHQKSPVPLTHDLLLSKLGEKNSPPATEALEDLTPFATIRRYEEGTYVLNDSDIENAIQAASDVVVWAQSKIGI